MSIKLIQNSLSSQKKDLLSPAEREATTSEHKHNEKADYSSGESVFDESRVDFQSLTAAQKRDHIKELWRMCCLKAVGAANLQSIFSKLHSRVLKYGTTRNINKNRVDLE